MLRTEMKRGLAIVAVSALVITAAPMAAWATTIGDQVTPGKVVLYSQFNAGSQASVRNDGTDATVHLEAGAGVGISSVTFQYSIQGITPGPWLPIRTVSRNADGSFSFEWAAGALAGSTVTLRATGTPTGGTAVNDDQAGVLIEGAGTADNTVNLTDGSPIGFFQQPYAPPNRPQLVVVSGTTSATTGTVAVARRDGTGAVASAVVAAPVTVASGATTGTFRGVVDIAGVTAYPYETTANPPVDQIVFGAERDTDDTEAYTLYGQAITTVSATAADTLVPTGATAPVVVTVLDQGGKPIAGAQVYSSTTEGTGTAAYTDANGRATLQQGAGTAYYYANSTNISKYDESVDKKSGDVTITSYEPAATSLKVTSLDGPVFDADENAAGDISVQVKDQGGDDFSTLLQNVDYYWVITPFDGAPASIRSPATGTTSAMTSGGAADIALPAEESGTYELYAALSGAILTGANPLPNAKVLTVKVGQAKIAYAAPGPRQAPAGTTVPLAGSLALEDGTGLPGRGVNLTYTKGTEVSPVGAGDAGLVQTNGTLGATLAVTTTVAGTFAASVKDPVETPQPSELGGDLDSATGATVGIGNAAATTNDQKIDFVVSVTPASIVIDPEVALGAADGKTPGRPVSSKVTVKAADGTLMANQSVKLRTDKGFFTPYAATFGALTPDPAAASGANAGEWKSLGQSITVATDANGVASLSLAIERDAGFDDDGKVDATLTAAVASIADAEVVNWTSANPYNGGQTRLELSPAAVQESGVLPKAPTSDKVFFDVFTTDQFGNRVGNETVTLSDNVANAAPSVASTTSNFAADGDFFVTSSAAQDQAVTGTWTTETHTYSSAIPPLTQPAIAAGTETLTDSSTVNWYVVDYADSTYALVRSGGAKQPVGSTVTETYAASDQNGEPIANLYVQFLRTGPGSQQGGDDAFDALLGQDGSISYVFQGGRAGTATITAVGRDTSASGDVVPAAQKSGGVTFAGRAVAIRPRLTLRNSANGSDKVTVSARRAKGAAVRVYRVAASGRRILVKAGVLSSSGTKTFTVRDKNGNKLTKYVAVVSPTSATLRGTTNSAKIQ